MIALSASRCAEVVGGYLSQCPAESMITGIKTDSRAVVPGDLFVAIRGEHFDGLDFAADALAHGAVAILASEALVGVPVVVCPRDSIDSLQQLARWQRDQLSETVVVAVTGSAGKTLTKDMIAAVLSSAGEVVAARESANNEIGLPMTLLAATPKTKYLVVEFGARRVGDIAALVEIARPDLGVVTNVGLAHVEIFGSIELTQQAKSELVTGLPAQAWAVLNADDVRVAAMASQTQARIITFGASDGADVCFSEVSVSGFGDTSFTVTSNLPESKGEVAKVVLNLAGRHLANNATAALAVGLSLGVKLTDGARSLSAMALASPHRAKVLTAGDITIIDDSYNANPESMKAALSVLADVAGPRRKVAVIGDMRELGDQSQAAHERIGDELVATDVAVLVAVGSWAKFYVKSQPQHVKTFAVHDAVEAFDALKAVLLAGDVVLVKASRVLGLEKVVSSLVNDRAQVSA